MRGTVALTLLAVLLAAGCSNSPLQLVPVDFSVGGLASAAGGPLFFTTPSAGTSSSMPPRLTWGPSTSTSTLRSTDSSALAWYRGGAARR